MPTLLHVDSSINGSQSHSRQVTAAFAAEWRQAHPQGEYLYRDLAAEPVAHLDAATHAAHNTPPSEHTPEQATAYRASKPIGDEVESADLILVGAPMYNFTIPSLLKAWLDHIAIPRFRADAQTGKSPLSDTKIVVATSRGGSYGPGTPRESFDHQEPYLRSLFNSIGADQDLTFLHTEMALSLVVPELAQFKDIYDQSSQDSLRRARELARA